MEKVIDLLLDYLKETGKDIHSYSLDIGFGYDRAEAEEFKALALSVINSRLKSSSPYAAGAAHIPDWRYHKRAHGALSFGLRHCGTRSLSHHKYIWRTYYKAKRRLQ